MNISFYFGRYDDFFTSKKKFDKSKNSQVNKELNKEVEDVDMSEEEENEDSDIGDEDGDDMASDDEVV